MTRVFATLTHRNAYRACVVCSLFVWVGAQAQTVPMGVPNFAPDERTSWYPDRPDGDNFLPPESGPGPIMQVKDKPYVPNQGFRTDDPDLKRKYPRAGGEDYAASHPTYRFADLSNPILQPWVRMQMKRDNDEVAAGKIPFMARERCLPGGVPEFDIYRRVGAPMLFFIQTPKEVLIVWKSDMQTRHVYLNVPHSAHPKPSWYGESVGHYQGGDTLVVDTIGLNTKTYVDNYRTPHTAQLHVIERFRIADGGKRLIVNIHVEDPGAFTTPWNAVQRFARWTHDPMEEWSCSESAPLDQFTYGNYGASHVAGVVPIPIAAKPDF
jgi:hypothetical protein